MGGAERWMHKVAVYLNKKEKSEIICAGEKIANVYGQMVLHRNFSQRVQTTDISISHISFHTLVPFTKSHKLLLKKFTQARIIYAKGELLELLICLYFGGPQVLKKTILGLHSSFIYLYPSSFFDWVHKFIYESFLSRIVFSRVKKTHVLNLKDKNFLEQKWGITNTALISNSVQSSAKTEVKKSETGKLQVLFVGELIYRKGIDLLILIIKNSPVTIDFYIAGDGPFTKKIIDLCKLHSNCHYLGYMDHNKLLQVYSKMDCLFLPSRAESFPFVFLEALSNGLVILSSDAAAINLPRNYLYSYSLNSVQPFIDCLKKLQVRKNNKDLNKEEIKRYFEQTFTDEKVLPILSSILFEVK